MTSAEIQRELAVHLFAEGKLSFGKARELGRLGFLEFQHLLASRRIPVHYDFLIWLNTKKTLPRLRALMPNERRQQYFTNHQSYRDPTATVQRRAGYA